MASFFRSFSLSFLALAGWLLTASPLVLQAESAAPGGIKAVAFDAFPIFDPRPIGHLAESLFPGRGAELMKAWRTRQFEYQWLRALGGRYENFEVVTEDALTFAGRQLALEISSEDRAKLLAAYENLTPWPDAAEALMALKARGYKVVFLSNMTAKMLRSGLKGAGLEDAFDGIYSTDARRTFKPSPDAYRIALDELGLTRDQIVFVAFAGWDAAGAKWFGYPTFWVNRAGSPPEELGEQPDGAGPDLQALIAFLDARSQPQANPQPAAGENDRR